MTGVRALVQRPARKMHLAVQSADLSWTTFCDLQVADEGTTRYLLDTVGGVRPALVKQQRGAIALAARPGLCAHCRRFTMLVELLQQDAAYGVAHEYRLTA